MVRPLIVFVNRLHVMTLVLSHGVLFLSHADSNENEDEDENYH